MFIPADEYSSRAPYDLLSAAARGHVAFDGRLLRALLADPERLVADLVRFTGDDRSGDLIDISLDLVNLCRRHPRPEAIPFLIGEIKRFPDDVPDEITETLVILGKPAIEPLLDLARAEPELRGEAAFQLATLGIPDPRIEELIADIRTGDPAEADFLEEIYAGRGARAEEPAFDIFAEYPEVAYPDLDELPAAEAREFLEAGDAELRAAAVRRLGEEESAGDDKQLFRTLAESDPAPEVRAAAWEVLGSVDDSEPTVDRMRSRLLDPSTPPVEQAGLCVALHRFLDEPAIARRLDSLLGEPATRAAAIHAMWLSMDRRFGPRIVPYLDDPDLEVRQHAVLAVGFLRVTSEVHRLECLFGDPDCRHDAIHAYLLCAPSEESRYGMRRLIDRAEHFAGGFSPSERATVESAVNFRLQLAGRAPMFGAGEPEPAPDAPRPKVGRNDPCPCGSGKKYKKCCGV